MAGITVDYLGNAVTTPGNGTANELGHLCDRGTNVYVNDVKYYGGLISPSNLSGTVQGPATVVTDQRIVIFDGTTGRLVKQSGALSDATGNITTPTLAAISANGDINAGRGQFGVTEVQAIVGTVNLWTAFVTRPRYIKVSGSAVPIIRLPKIGAGAAQAAVGHRVSIWNTGATAIPVKDSTGATTFTTLLQNQIGEFSGLTAAVPDVWDAVISDTTTAGVLTTKGDIYTFDTADQRLAVGADTTVLTATSAAATGLAWAAPDPLTTKGDIFTFDTDAQRLAVGVTNGMMLSVNSATATGLQWIVPVSSAASSVDHEIVTFNSTTGVVLRNENVFPSASKSYFTITETVAASGMKRLQFNKSGLTDGSIIIGDVNTGGATAFSGANAKNDVIIGPGAGSGMNSTAAASNPSVLVGTNAGSGSTTHNGNVAVGYNTVVTSAGGATAVGLIAQAGQNATAVGNNAIASGGSSCAFGINSSATGASAAVYGFGATTVGPNDCIHGEGSTSASTTGANCIFGAANAIQGVANTRVFIGGSSNQVNANDVCVLGSGFTGGLAVSTASSMWMNVLATLAGTAIVQDAVTGQMGRLTSSARYKEDIQNIDDKDSSAIYTLQPKTFFYKGEKTSKDIDGKDRKRKRCAGLIAEEVVAIPGLEFLVRMAPNMDFKDELDESDITYTDEKRPQKRRKGEYIPVSGDLPESIDYTGVTMLLLDQIQKINARVIALEAR